MDVEGWLRARHPAEETLAPNVVRASDRLRPRVTVVRKEAGDDPAARAALSREVGAARRLSHPRIRRLLAAAGAVAVFEHVDGVALDEHLAAEPKHAEACAIEMLRVLLHMHVRGLAHGDLKPQNCLVTSPAGSTETGSIELGLIELGLIELGLIDLGLVTPFGERPRGGTRPFLAPEYERGAVASVAGDLFAFGKTFEPWHSHLPDPVARVVRDCASHEPESRPASVEVALAAIGAVARPIDRSGRVPLHGLEEVMPRIAQVLSLTEGASTAGATLVAIGPPGAGRSRLLEEVRALAIERAVPVADLSGRDGHEPLRALADILSIPRSVGADDEARRFVAAIVRASAEGTCLVVEDVDDAPEAVQQALLRSVPALRARGRGPLILIGASSAHADAAAPTDRFDLPSVDDAGARRILHAHGVRASAALARAIRRGARGRAGAIVDAARAVSEQPAMPVAEAGELARSLVEDPPRQVEAVPHDAAEAVVRIDALLKSGAPRRAEALLASLDPEDAEVAERRARILAARGRLADAVAAVDGASSSSRALQVEALFWRERLGRLEETLSRAIPLLEVDDEHRSRVALVAAMAALALGDPTRARAFVETGLNGHCPDRIRAQLSLIRSDIELRSSEPEAAVRSAEDALSIEEVRRDAWLRARAEARLASAYGLSGDPTRALVHHRAALEAAEASGDVLGLVPYVVNLATAEHGAGELGAAIVHYEEAARLAEQLQRPAMLAVALVNLASLLASLQQLDEATAVVARAAAAADDAGSALFAAQAMLVEAELGGATDRRRGRALAERAQRAFVDCGATRQALEARLLRCELASDAAQAREALSFAERHESELRDAGLADRARVMRAAALHRMSEPATARDVLGDPADLDDDVLSLRAHALRAELETACGSDPDPAKQSAWTVANRIADELPAGLRDRFLSAPPHAALRPAPTAASAETGPALGDAGRRILSLVRRVLLQGDERVLLSDALDEAIALTRAERAFLLRRRRGKGQDDVVVARNLDGDAIRRGKARFSRSVADRVVGTGEPILTAAATDDPELAQARSILDLGVRSILCVPVRSADRIVGALYLDHRFEAARFTDRSREVVQALADVIGLALENYRLHRDARERTEELSRAHDAVSRENVRQAAELERLHDRLTRAEGIDDAEGAIVGRSPKLKLALGIARRVAASELPVLLSGESGTGKELFARYIHHRSLRADGPFVAINCGALSETLLESELFGHVRGAFTGALRDHPGLFRAARGGTLFLDEVGEMPARMQTRLLRVLQEREVRSVGGSEADPVDVRVLAATNRDLPAEVEARRFRRDLYFRLVGARLELPPLRERLEDLPLLAQQALSRIAAEPGMREVRLTRSAIRALSHHDWPGNVRELEQALRRAVLISEGDRIEPEHLALVAAPRTREAALRRFDREIVAGALREAEGNRSQAARILGVSRPTLYRWMKRYGL